MNRNSYVTAALFVVFVLLTVVYFNLDNTGPVTDGIGSVVINGTDQQTPMPVGDLVNTPDEDEDDAAPQPGQSQQQTPAPTNEETQQAPAPGGQTEEQQAPAPGGNGSSELGAGSDVTEQRTTSRVAALRHEIETNHHAMVATLTEIVASPDHDAATKNEAMDQLNVLDGIANSRRLLETTLLSLGFTDVVVDANAENQVVNVTVEVMDFDTVSEQERRETSAEITLLTMQQFRSFGNRNQINVNFTPIN
ncbi:MAG: SpoIIIAH-like family protein [Turicibacter sp.]|nr:SpoIIIAH-like family protein [Turicibacter sp.]